MCHSLLDAQTTLLARRLRPWRAARLAAAITVVIAFFLPNESSSPLADSLLAFWVTGIERTHMLASGPWPWSAYSIAWFWLFRVSVGLVPYLFAALVSSQAAGDLIGSSRHHRATASAKFLALAGAIVCYPAGEIIGRVALGLHRFGHPLANSLDDYAWILVLIGGGWYLARARRLGDRAATYSDFAGTCIILIWCWAHAMNGLSWDVMEAATVVLLITFVAEQVVLRRPRYGKGRCPNCGYLLRGLRDQRCPECGRPFTFEEIRVSPEELGFRTADEA